MGGGLIEHEYHHVFVGRFNGEPAPHPDEVDDWRWIDVAARRREVRERPRRVRYWFHVAFDELRARGVL